MYGRETKFGEIRLRKKFRKVLSELEQCGEFPEVSIVKRLELKIMDRHSRTTAFVIFHYKIPKRIVLNISNLSRKVDKELIYILGHEIAHVIANKRGAHQHDKIFKQVEDKVMDKLGLVLIFNNKKRAYPDYIYRKEEFAKHMLLKMQGLEIAAVEEQK